MCLFSDLITGQFTGEIFSQQIWNSKLMDYWNNNNPESLKDLFVDQMADGTALNSLNLNKVYILTTSRSASASELLINGLASHIDIIQIGDTTYGKNVGSITVYDYIDNDGTKNPDHTYAMQPIVLKIANSAGFADYDSGLDANVELKKIYLIWEFWEKFQNPFFPLLLIKSLVVVKRITKLLCQLKILLIIFEKSICRQ